jgi:hypothetical protein
MSQPSTWWQKCGTLAQAAVALIGFVAKTAGVGSPDCRWAKA